MRMKARAKTGATAALLTVPALLLVTACGSGGAGDDARNGRRDGASALPTAAGRGGGSGQGPVVAGPLSRERLERAALTEADLPGYAVSATAAPDADTGRPVADRAACQPLADAIGDEPGPGAVASVNRGLGSQRTMGLAIAASLASYRESDARKLVRDVRSALGSCAKGYEVNSGGEAGTYAPVRLAPFGAAGDESVSWTVSALSRGVRSSFHVVVVREGATVVRLIALNLGSDRGPRVPADVAEQQLRKLDRVVRG
ncbi:hypothetical protein [Streptomyces sp. NPDC050504]|uniref:hypothetical protein n=1 Tax=Streptomyces sp. NPDC050504 TaxID=3365618 RepID=UPI00378E537B